MDGVTTKVRKAPGAVIGLAELEDANIHRDELAQLLGLQSAQMLDVHAREGHLVRADKKGWFKLGASIKAITEHQRSVAAKHRSGDGKHDVAAESAQLKSAGRPGRPIRARRSVRPSGSCLLRQLWWRGSERGAGADHGSGGCASSRAWPR